MHILHKRVSFPPRSPLCKRPHPVARGWAHSHIYRGTHSPGGGSRETPTVVVTLACRRRCVSGSPLFNRDQNPPPLCPAPVAPSLPHIHIFPPTALYLSALRLVPSRLSEHRHALRGITRRTRVVVIYAACTLVCTYVRGARVRVRANVESGCTMRQVYSATQSIGKR